jgi:ribosome-binding protein aMBF1 (putative translation factor)
LHCLWNLGKGLYMFEFGSLLRQLRWDSGLTQEHFAQQVGCTVEFLEAIEQAEERPPRSVAEQMARVLQLSHEERRAFVRIACSDPSAHK